MADPSDIFVDPHRGILGLDIQRWWVPEMPCALTQVFEWARENAWAYPTPPGTGVVLAQVDAPLFRDGGASGRASGQLWWNRGYPGATDSATDGYLQGNVTQFYSGRSPLVGFRTVGILTISMRVPWEEMRVVPDGWVSLSTWKYLPEYFPTVTFDAFCDGTTLWGDENKLHLSDGAPGGQYRVNLQFGYSR